MCKASGMENPIFLLLLLLVVVLVGWKVFSGGLFGARFVVQVRGAAPEDIAFQGDAPGYSAAEVAEFVRSLDLPPGARIWGMPFGPRIRLHFSPEVPEHLHQRLRNFFYARL